MATATGPSQAGHPPEVESSSSIVSSRSAVSVLVISEFNVVIPVSPLAGEETIPATGIAEVKRDGPGRLCLWSRTTDCQNVASGVSELVRLRELLGQPGERLSKNAKISERRCRILIRTAS
jgi:hypothetical protein